MRDKSYLRFFKIVSQIPRNAQGKISKEQKEELIRKKEKLEIQEKKRGENYVVFEGVVSEGCFYFNGHFVDFPLVPGFVQLDLALSYAQTLGVMPEDILKIMHIKFTAFLRPRDRCRLHLEKVGQNLFFKMFSNDQMCLSGKALLKEERGLG